MRKVGIEGTGSGHSPRTWPPRRLALGLVLGLVLLAASAINTSTGRRWVVRNTAVRKAWLPAVPFRGYYVQPSEEALFNPLRPTNYTVQYTEEGVSFGGRRWQALPRQYDCPPINNASTITILLNRPSIGRTDRDAAAGRDGAGRRFRHVHVWQAEDKTARHDGQLDGRSRDRDDVYALVNMEPPTNYPEFLSDEQAAKFDLDIGYRPRTASVLQMYLPDTLPEWLKMLRAPPRVPWSKKRRPRPILVSAVSNCDDHNGRGHLVGALQRHMGPYFANYGKCHPSPVAINGTGNAEAEGRHFDNGEIFETAVRSSLFVLAVENANCESYITEKLRRAIAAGVVPIVFDAPQSLGGGPDDTMVPGYAGFLPPGTYINVADFGTVAALGRHLIELSRNETAYAALLWTRQAGISDDFIKSRWFQHRSYGVSNSNAATPPWLDSEGKIVIDKRCQLARAALGTGGGGAGPRLQPDHSCLPDRVLCNSVPDASPACKPSTAGDRLRPLYRHG